MTLDLAIDLIRRQSITPKDAGCQELIADHLKRSGFRPQHLRFGEVDNLWITHGDGAPVFCFLGHTDVVPSGPVTAWRSDPFEPVVRGNMLYGRGAADMKGGVAAMVTALERFVTARPDHRGTAALLLTSDEEGPALDGTRRVVEYLTANDVRVDWCLVGEPSSRDVLGDAIKIGRRGSMTGKLIVDGIQGHVAYPAQADNPIHRGAPALAELCAIEWDRGNEHYPPTSFQISNIHAGTGVDNVIPGQLEVLFNFRFSSCLTPAQIQARVEEVLARHGLRFRVDWRAPILPFLTTGGALLEAVQDTVLEVAGRRPERLTTGGTSDGRFIAPTGAEVVELGPCNRTIHQVDECVGVAELESLAVMYEKILQRLLG
jgi:succinyl-diaminopimelate desuccinylase